MVITKSTGEGKFLVTKTRLYVPVVTLSTQDNAKLHQRLKSGFRRTINWNKYQSNPKTYAQNIYLNHLADSSFQEVKQTCINVTVNVLSSKSTNKRLQFYD